jgi:hypothetical protein
MKKFNTLKIWFGKKLVDWGFAILLRMDDRDWNSKKECYPGSIKQFKYTVGSWLVKHGIHLESKSLDKAGWPGFTVKYYDKDFYKHLPRPHKRRRKNNDGPDFNNFFPDWQ